MFVYLDHAATSPLRREALAEFVRHAEVIGNPSALHRAGQRARAVLEEARERLAVAVGAHPTEVVFTSGGSEADSIAVLGSRFANQGRETVVFSAIEHPAVGQIKDFPSRIWPVSESGVLELTRPPQLDDSVAVVSVMQVNNEIGTIQPIAAAAELAHAAGAWMHTDAVQGLGHVPVDFGALPVDLMSLSAHKVGGPVGVGALLARREVVPKPIGLGGGQERALRSGTVPVALCAAFAVAAELAVAELAETTVRLGDLRDQIAELAVGLGARLNSGPDGSAHIVNATFDGTRADDLLYLLDVAGIHASVGSACRAGVHQPSEVLLAMGRDVASATASLRFSLGQQSSQADIDRLREVLPGALQQARGAFVQGA